MSVSRLENGRRCPPKRSRLLWCVIQASGLWQLSAVPYRREADLPRTRFTPNAKVAPRSTDEPIADRVATASVVNRPLPKLTFSDEVFHPIKHDGLANNDSTVCINACYAYRSFLHRTVTRAPAVPEMLVFWFAGIGSRVAAG